MQLQFIDKTGKVSKKEVDSKLFTEKGSEVALAKYMRVYANNQRRSNAHTKTRADVSGGGRKPWRQKGTGRARHGSSRSPIWVGGGVTFGPRNIENYKLRINKKEKMSALVFLLNQMAEKDMLFVVEMPKAAKTKDASIFFAKAEMNRATVVHDDKELYKVLNNLENVTPKTLADLSIYDMATSGRLVFTESAFTKFLESNDSKIA